MSGVYILFKCVSYQASGFKMKKTLKFDIWKLKMPKNFALKNTNV